MISPEQDSPPKTASRKHVQHVGRSVSTASSRADEYPPSTLPFRAAPNSPPGGCAERSRGKQVWAECTDRPDSRREAFQSKLPLLAPFHSLGNIVRPLLSSDSRCRREHRPFHR
uniref:Uncharacterized protein n=1 Tax=Anopheles atroparvus TaxID=41427 RepID=A0AAG5CUU4_ANOAO